MESPLFRVKTFAIDEPDKCACIVTGYRGRIASYKEVIRSLNEKGYLVVAYEHPHTVFTQGDPKLLPILVDQICSDFAMRSSGYKEVICTGASLGAGLCFAIQRQLPTIKFGIYAGAGVSPPQTVHEAPLFYFVRKKFTKLGLGKAELQHEWREVDILPDTRFSRAPFIMALGKKDRIVDYIKALETLHAWQDQGQTIQIVLRPNLGHIGVIRWYKSHFSELLAAAEELSL